MHLRKATADELPWVKGLYASAIGTAGCTWNEFYPGEWELTQDFSTGNLYVLAEGELPLGAVSVVPERELDDFTCWRIRENVREVARVVISRERAGCGLAALMLTELFQRLKGDGCAAIHLSVALGNRAALRTYEKLGFQFLERVELYGGEYVLCEREL